MACRASAEEDVLTRQGPSGPAAADPCPAPAPEVVPPGLRGLSFRRSGTYWDGRETWARDVYREEAPAERRSRP